MGACRKFRADSGHRQADDEVAFQSISLMCYLVVARLDLVGSAGYVWLVLLVALVMFGCLGVESIS